MKIDLTCPCEVLRCRLNDEDHHTADVTLNNLSDKTITSTEVTLILHHRDEEEPVRVLHRAHDLRARADDPFVFSVPLPTQDAGPEKIEVIIEKIWYDDATVWRRGKAQMTEYEPNALPAGRELEQLRYVAGRQAVGYPQEQAHAWLCVCGRPNSYASGVCAHCGNSREEVFRLYSKESVQERIAQQEARLQAQTKAAMETTNRQQQAREKAWELKRKRNKRWIRFIVILLILALLGAGYIFYLHPYLRYQNAVKDLREGRYDTAIAVFTEMEDYRDSASMLTRTYYEKARASLENADMETLLAARDTFEQLGTYLDSATYLKQVDYQRAEILLGEGQLKDATDLFRSLGNYLDSPERVKECIYIKAGEMEAGGSYEEAMLAYETLDAYEDSKERARTCRILAAEAALDAEDPDHAMELLIDSLITDDAVLLRQRAHYLKGQQLYASEDMVQAGQEFLLAGDYLDAADQASQCIYAPATALMEARDYLTAADMFASISGYLDSEEMTRKCIYLAAQEALKDTEYQRATELLQQLPVDYEDTETLRKECIYRPAVAALEKGEYETALNAFLSLGDYSDCARMVQRTQYAWAEALVQEEKYEDAIALYEALGNYLRAPVLLKETQYMYAEKLADEQKYTEAAAYYQLLGNYKQSKTRLNAVLYTQATQAFSEGEIETARSIFASLGSYQDSRDQVRACDYALAIRMQEDGELESAIQAFTALGNYLDCKERIKDCQMSIALQLLEDGKPEEAREILESLGNDEDAKAQLLAMDYAQAERLAAEGLHEEAAAQFIALGDYLDAASRAQAEYYEIATTAAEEGQQGTAAVFYEKAGDFEDAQDKSESYGDMLYEEPAALARKAAVQENWPAVAWLLSSLDMELLPENYQDLKDLFEESCLKAGLDLIATGDDLKAYPYLQRVWSKDEVQALITDRRFYQMLGIWEGNGHTLKLSGDESAEVDGETFTWALDGYMILLDSSEAFSLVSEPQSDSMVLRDRRVTGISSWNMKKTGQDPFLPIPEVDLTDLWEADEDTVD